MTSATGFLLLKAVLCHSKTGTGEAAHKLHHTCRCADVHMCIQTYRPTDLRSYVPTWVHSHLRYCNVLQWILSLVKILAAAAGRFGEKKFWPSADQYQRRVGETTESLCHWGGHRGIPWSSWFNGILLYTYTLNNTWIKIASWPCVLCPNTSSFGGFVSLGFLGVGTRGSIRTFCMGYVQHHYDHDPASSRGIALMQ